MACTLFLFPYMAELAALFFAMLLQDDAHPIALSAGRLVLRLLCRAEGMVAWAGPPVYTGYFCTRAANDVCPVWGREIRICAC
jgi:hypothetical protein